MAIKFVNVNAFLMVLVGSHAKECHSIFDRKIFISKLAGHNDHECLHDSSSLHKCKTLDFVLNEFVKGTIQRKSIKIEIEGSQFLEKNYNLTKLKDFALCGTAKKQKSEIECNFRSGLIIQSSERIGIEHLSFRRCGSVQRSNDFEHYSFYTGIFLVNTVNVRINHCSIVDSTGIGMTLFDVGGHVTFNHTVFQGNQGNSRKKTKFLAGVASVGGGLMVEFTYSGGLAPYNSSKNVYYFHHCMFINNKCTWNRYSNKMDHRAQAGLVGDGSSVSFGHGGGLGMFFRGQANDNMIVVDHCEFRNNSAEWGGGYLFYFQDKSQNNSVQLEHVISESNHANFAGGGGLFGFFAVTGHSDHIKLHPNYFKHTYCRYQYNSAKWGGAIAIGASTAFPENYGKEINLSFSHCLWLRNQAVVGSALGLLSEWIYPRQQKTQHTGKRLAYVVLLVNCMCKENIIDYISDLYQSTIIGSGTIYSNIAPVIMQNVSLCFNSGTALVLDGNFVYIFDYVIFHKNSGSKGGGMALYGRSGVILGQNSFLNFTSNTAQLQGGAIYAHSQGADIRAFDTQIFDRSTCLFSYTDLNVPPENWTAKVTFYNNSASHMSGKSVYIDTLQFCRHYGSLETALEWIPVFEYIPSSKDNYTVNPEIVTDPVTINTDKNSWKVFPGQEFNPVIELRDEKNQTTNGLLKILIKSNSSINLEKQVSHYLYVSNGKSSTPLSLKSLKRTGTYDIVLSSVYSQVITTTLENITIQECYGGYVFDEKKQKCVCPEKDKMPYGYSRCEGDGKTIYLKKGYWGITNKDGQLNVFPCPPGYCKCVSASGKRTTAQDECVFVRFDRKSNQCEKNRHGNLCGSCMKGFSVVVGEQNCGKCSDKGLLWLIPIAAGLTVVVFAIIYFEIDFFSGPLNSWLYTYNIISSLPASAQYLDPFIKFVIGLSNGLFDINEGKCFWDEMDALQKYTLQYLMPFYCLSLLFVIAKLLRYFPNLPLSRRSFHHAFVTVVIISYASLLRNTMTILQPIVICSKIYVYIQADVKYFGSEHLPYAIPALLILFVIVIPFPFIIAFSGFFTRHFQCLRGFMPLFEVLQRPYRTDAVGLHPTTSFVGYFSS